MTRVTPKLSSGRADSGNEARASTTQWRNNREDVTSAAPRISQTLSLKWANSCRKQCKQYDLHHIKLLQKETDKWRFRRTFSNHRIQRNLSGLKTCKNVWKPLFGMIKEEVQETSKSTKEGTHRASGSWVIWVHCFTECKLAKGCFLI